MSTLATHPTVLIARKSQPSSVPSVLDADWLRDLCREAGADDVGFVEVERPALEPDRDDILSALPRAKAVIGFVVRMNRAPLRTPARSIANLEFHHVGDEVNEVARRIIAKLETLGIEAINPAMGFPMEMDHFPGKLWTISHKLVAEAAGLGVMGIHRIVIHPKFGNYVLLGSVILGAQVSRYDHPVDFDPCLECKLCVAACPTGAIKPDGAFDFSACYTHNYREFMGGFTDWVENVAESSNARDYRRRVSDPESASMWQSLSFGANYKAAYCMAVCPAGEDVIGPFLNDKKQYVGDFVRPLQDKEETIYVLPNSDAEAHVAKRFAAKTSQRVGSGLRPRSIPGFLAGIRLTFQRDQAAGLDAVYHFLFSGEETAEATVTLRNKELHIETGLHGNADLTVRADSRAWLDFLAKNRGLVGALVTRKIKLSGPPKLLVAFGRCFA